MNTFYIFLIILFSAVCLYIVYTYYNVMLKKKKESEFIENKEFLEKASTIDSTLFFFHTDWCPHCKDSMNIWKSIKTDMKFKKFKTAFVTIDCEDKKNQHLVEKYKVNEYPTFILESKGKTFIYDANLNPETLERFFISVYKKL